MTVQPASVTQAMLADGIGCTQGNIGHYENKGQTVPPDVAKELIRFAATKGHAVTFEDIDNACAIIEKTLTEMD